jgi:hypothetical protein
MNVIYMPSKQEQEKKSLGILDILDLFDGSGCIVSSMMRFYGPDEYIAWETFVLVPRILYEGYEITGEFRTLKSTAPIMRAIWVKKKDVKFLGYYLWSMEGDNIYERSAQHLSFGYNRARIS